MRRLRLLVLDIDAMIFFMFYMAVGILRLMPPEKVVKKLEKLRDNYVAAVKRI